MKLKRLSHNWRGIAAVALALGHTASPRADTPQVVNCDGYPCVNFSLGANISTNGEIFGSLFFNRPQLGEGLDPLGGGRFRFGVAGRMLGASECAMRSVRRAWPFAEVRLGDPRLEGVEIQARVVVPNALDDAFTGSLPVALAEFVLTNTAGAERMVSVSFEAPAFLKESVRALEANGVAGLESGKNFIGWVKPVQGQSSNALSQIDCALAPRGSAVLRFLLGHWEDNWPSSARLTTPGRLADHAARHWNSLFAGSRRLEEKLPRPGDARLDEYLRWYATAGVAMTRVLKDGTALTMGYHELNQRDSYWTTWIHLALWPSLEKRMIQESAWGQRPDGKVPTTLLPLIEREDDIDINCFFILRGLRYARFHQDQEFGRALLPSLLQAADWLASRDGESSGLPQGASYWYDWKDVGGVTGRKYSPYASMLYVAAVGRLAAYCEAIGETASAARLRARADKAAALLHRPISEGGLWNGRYYQQVWRDGRASPQVLQDQVVGILFGVLNPPRSRSVLEALRANESPWGCRETYPYHSNSFGYRGGDYHNGGIWPWLNHAHAWALLRLGERDQAFELIRRMGHADLELAGDFIPHEYLDGETGKQAGVPMQGWNAALFGALFFGGPDREAP
jgi:hypothetical protein